MNIETSRKTIQYIYANHSWQLSTENGISKMMIDADADADYVHK